MLRWTLFSSDWLKVLVHHFMPGSDDPDTHDHPRPFITLVLRGGYWDITEDGKREAVFAPALRYRRAEHAHRTLVGRKGAWTIVVMGKVTRPWGFFRDKVWYHFKDYERIFGFSFRCPD